MFIHSDKKLLGSKSKSFMSNTVENSVPQFTDASLGFARNQFKISVAVDFGTDGIGTLSQIIL